MIKQLGVKDKDGKIIPITSQDNKYCYQCGKELNSCNSSEWEVFTAESKGSKTARVCLDCEAGTTEKEEDPWGRDRY